MKLSEQWRLSRTLYKEIAFQSIFSLRAGSSLPQRGRKDVNQIISSARMSTLISKLTTCLFIAVFALTLFLPLSLDAMPLNSPLELTFVASSSAFFAVVLFLIVFMGLQVSTSFVSSKAVDVLSHLPLTKKDASRIVFFSFIRIFDLPLVAGFVTFLTAYLFLGGSALGSFISLVAIGVSEIFAISLTVGLARFFYSKITGGGGRSRWQSLIRLAFILIWILPTFAAYLLISFAPNLVGSLNFVTEPYVLQVLVIIFPFTYGFLLSVVTYNLNVGSLALGVAIASSVAYVIAAFFCFRWVADKVRTLGANAYKRTREIVEDTVIKLQTPWLGIILKDVRVASRAPSYASLFLLPAIQTIFLAISFSSAEMVLSTALGILTGISLITLLLPQTLLSIEGLGSTYTRALPLTRRTMISAKTLLTILTYLLSLLVLFVVASLMGRDFYFIMVFGLVHTFALASGVMLELVLLLNKFWSEGFAVGNVYSRLSSYLLILIPGFIVAIIPMAIAFLTFLFLTQDLVIGVFLVIAIIEFLLMSLVALSKK